LHYESTFRLLLGGVERRDMGASGVMAALLSRDDIKMKLASVYDQVQGNWLRKAVPVDPVSKS
jgi:hypothetical protein